MKTDEFCTSRSQMLTDFKFSPDGTNLAVFTREGHSLKVCDMGLVREGSHSGTWIIGLLPISIVGTGHTKGTRPLWVKASIEGVMIGGRQSGRGIGRFMFLRLIPIEGLISHCGPHFGWIYVVISSIYRLDVTSLPIENHLVIKCFTWWVDEFTRLTAGKKLVNFTRFMIDFNRHFCHLERVNFDRALGESESPAVMINFLIYLMAVFTL